MIHSKYLKRLLDKLLTKSSTINQPSESLKMHLTITASRAFSKTMIIAMGLALSAKAYAEIEISQSLEGLTAEEKAWLTDDSNLEAFAISEGELRWSSKASKENYWLENHLTIDAKSLQNGWIKFSQCHHQLDAVNKIEVAYNPSKTRNLEVKSFQGIDSVKVIGSGVELTKVSKGSKVCIDGESRTLTSNDLGYVIQRGPYMRKFLDGYYPMIVEESLFFKGLDIEITEVTPKSPQTAQTPTMLKSKNDNEANELNYSYAFEGRLMPQYRFTKKANN